jgi:hypothetical protein
MNDQLILDLIRAASFIATTIVAYLLIRVTKQNQELLKEREVIADYVQKRINVYASSDMRTIRVDTNDCFSREMTETLVDAKPDLQFAEHKSESKADVYDILLKTAQRTRQKDKA